jgi:hypothetical protein
MNAKTRVSGVQHGTEEAKFLVPSADAFDKLEARVAACEKTIAEGKKAEYERLRKDPAHFVKMYGFSTLSWNELMVLIGTPRRRNPLWIDYVYARNKLQNAQADLYADLYAEAFKVMTKHEKLVLRLFQDGSAGLRYPDKLTTGGGDIFDDTPSLRALSWQKCGARGVYNFAVFAEALRIVGCKHLTLKRYRKGVPMEVLTKWLTGLVNEHAPVMTIVSDPGFIE